MVLPYLMCTCCKYFYDNENFPVQSISCGHSICKSCVLSKGNQEHIIDNQREKPKSDNHDQDNTASTGNTTHTTTTNNNNIDEYFPCPLCHQPHAFHVRESKPNLLACTAILLLKDCDDLLEQINNDRIQQQDTNSNNSRAAVVWNPSSQSTEHQDQQNEDNQEESGTHFSETAGATNTSNSTSLTRRLFVASPSSSSTASIDNNIDKKLGDESNENDCNLKKKAYPTNQEHHHEQSHQDATKKRRIVSPSSSSSQVQTERMVFVNFPSCKQLAYLLSIENNMATIRWESCKYIDQVSIDMIEEMNNPDEENGTITKRTSRRQRCLRTSK